MQTMTTNIVAHETMNYSDMLRPCDCKRADCPEKVSDNLMYLVRKDTDHPVPGTFEYRMFNMQ